MPAFQVKTAQHSYASIVERGILARAQDFIPRSAGRLFVITTQDVWQLHGPVIRDVIDPNHVLFFPGGEVNKRLGAVENLAEQMVQLGADRTGVIVGFGGGIVTDVAGFVAAIFMRGIPVLQIPTTLLAQVDAALGGKTGVNLISGKNLIGSFHQPLAVLIDPDVLSTLPAREYRAGLFEVIKCGIIRDSNLFALLQTRADEVLSMQSGLVDQFIGAAVRIKAEVVSADERESNLRRILNFGHTIGHAIEAETGYVQFLHGEAVAWGMLAATRLAELLELLDPASGHSIRKTVCRYGPLPPANSLDPDALIARLANDKKTLQGNIHFVLPTAIGQVRIMSGVETAIVRRAIVESLQERP